MADKETNMTALHTLIMELLATPTLEKEMIDEFRRTLSTVIPTKDPVVDYDSDTDEGLDTLKGYLNSLSRLIGILKGRHDYVRLRVQFKEEENECREVDHKLREFMRRAEAEHPELFQDDADGTESMDHSEDEPVAEEPTEESADTEEA